MRDIHTSYPDSEISIREKKNYYTRLSISSYGAGSERQLVSGVYFDGTRTQNGGSVPPTTYPGRSIAIRTNVVVKSVKC